MGCYKLIAIVILLSVVCLFISNGEWLETKSLQLWHSESPYELRIIVNNELLDETEKTSAELHGKIYFGSNIEIALEFNTGEMMRNFTHPTDSTLIKRFPRCICIGVGKAGTAALQNFLSVHPDIVTSLVSEPLFFSEDIRYDKGLDQYLRWMDYSKSWQIGFEKSPFYLTSKKAAQRIHQFDSGIKLLMVVKNPVDRLLSHFLHNKEMFGNKTVEEVVMRPDGTIKDYGIYVDWSLYGKHFTNWITLFNRNQIHIVDGDSLIENPALELHKLERFLNIKNYFTEDRFYLNDTKGFYCLKNTTGQKYSVCKRADKGHINSSLGLVKSAIPFHNETHTMEKLRQFFKPHNQNFYMLTGKYFNWD